MRQNADQSKLDEVVDALTEKYVRADRQVVESLQEKTCIDPRVQGLLEHAREPEDWPLWQVKCTVSVSPMGFGVH